MKRFSVHAGLSTPYLWALLGTPLPPLNIAYVALFWLLAGPRRALARVEALRCLNVQITYTLTFFLPILLACALSTLERPGGEDLSFTFIRRLLTGFPLGLTSLAGILLLAFFNMRTFAHTVLEHPAKEVPRLKFLREATA